ncbi:chemotaxis protein CheB [Bermanella sp. R86510]|uniref:chemotaxis protein CheB n=1 Tax=unclassified Bermanella TaxID=2627862 RepID=UPI0037CC68DA
MTTALKLAVVAEDSLQQHRLRTALADFGCEVVSLSAQALELKGIDSEVAAWLVDLRDDDELLEPFFELEQPVLFGFEAAPSKQDKGYPRWEKRLYAKIKQLLGRDILQQSTMDQTNFSAIEQLGQQSDVLVLPESVQPNSGNPAENIWVLGSSLGGPEAIKAFLDALPSGLPVAFIYGQHIDAQFVPVLANVLARHSAFTLRVAEHGMVPKNGEVLIVPSDKEVRFDGGELNVSGTPWPGPYGPSVDQLILNTLKVYPQAGIMIFSGMGNDGAEAIESLCDGSASDIQVWAQSRESCASSAMPDAARETGAVSFSGSPQALAAQLVHTIQMQQATNKLLER